MVTTNRCLRPLAAAMACAAAMLAQAASVETPVQSGGAFEVPVQSLRGLRQAHTVRQQRDFSCGAAALATLLSHHYATPTGEPAVFDAMWQHGDTALIQRSGFSLLDMKRYLEGRGFAADGFEAPVSTLAQVGAPAIVLVQQNGVRHFVVVAGVAGGKVLFADPASGTRLLPLAEFEALRASPILLIVTDRLGMFNAAAHWRARPLAPLAEQARAGAALQWLRRERSDL